MDKLRLLLKRAGIAVMSLCLLALALAVHTWYFKPIKIDWFYGRVFAAFAMDQPEMLSSMGIVPPLLDFHSDKLNDISEAQAAKTDRLVHKALATLHSYERSALEGEARLSYDVLAYYLTMRAEEEQFRLHDFPVNQFDSVVTETFDFLVNVHDIDGEAAALDYLARLDKVPHKFSQAIDGLRLREAKGMLPPRFAVEKVMAQLAALAAAPAKDSPLVRSMDARLAKLPADVIAPARRAELVAQAERLVTGRIAPSLRALHGWFASIAPRAQSNDGAWRQPHGERHYAYAVRYYTTTDMTPREVHELGLAEVARIGAEMDGLLRERGLAEGGVGARMRQLGQDPAQRYGSGEADKQAMLARYQAILDEANREIGKAFDRRPKLGVEVRPMPDYAQAGAGGAYYASGSFDGARPGVFYANLRAPGDIPKFSMRTIAYHEGIPGHHFQAALAQEMQEVPFFRNVIDFPAYSEGWALYGERLAFELGFGKDPLDQLGRLRDDMLRAARLVVDTGLHYKRWSREQAIAYMAEQTGMAESEVEPEVERTIVRPGAVLAHKIGMLKILALREEARQQLGDRFDLRAFHNEVLGHGAMPMAVLEGVIRDWIARRRQG